jgi:hypothetical protein
MAAGILRGEMDVAEQHFWQSKPNPERSGVSFQNHSDTWIG